MGTRSSVMVGRDAELSLLLDALARAEAGEAQVALVTGEAGIGKTRLIREFVAGIPGATVVAMGHAVPRYGEALPYGVAADLLRSLVREVGSQAVTDILRSRCTTLAPVVPQLGDGAENPVDRSALYAATQDLLVGLSADRTVLLVVEDAHWADESSLDLIGFWARTIVRGRCLLVMSSRVLTVSERLHERLGELRRLPNTIALELSTLDESAVARQVQALRVNASEQLLADVRRLSQGIPLYVEELVASSADPSSRLTLDVGSGLKGVSAETADLVRLASLEDRPFTLSLWAKAAGQTRERVSFGADEAQAAGLLVRDAERRLWRFRHELVRQAVMTSVTSAFHEWGHRQWAMAWTSGGQGSLADLVASATHWDALEPGREAFLAYRSAAIRATDIAPSREAETLWRRALGVAQSSSGAASEAEHEEALGQIAVILLNPSATAALIEAEESGAPIPAGLRRDYVEALKLSSGVLRPTVASPSPSINHLARLRRRLATYSPSPSPLLLGAISELVFALDALGLTEERNRAARLVVEVDAALPRRAVRGLDPVVLAQLMMLEEPRGTEARLAITSRAVAEHATDDWASRSWSLMQHGMELITAGRIPEAVEHLRRALALIPGGSHEHHWRPTAAVAVWTYRLAGEWEEVMDLDARLRAVGIWSGDGLLVSMHRGEPPEASASTELDVDDYRVGRVLASRLARVLSAEDVTTARVVVVDELLRDLSAFWLAGECLLIAAHLALKAPPDDAYVATLRESAAHVLESTPLDACYSAHVHALLAEATDVGSAEIWREAERRWDAAGVPFHAAECRLWVARTLIKTGDTEGVDQLLGAALTTAEAMGATPLADEIRTCASRARLRLRGHELAETGSKGPLTDREHEVLQLLVQGMTNDQIGGALFMSPRTASVHVSHILAKLGAANRTEVATVAHRRGLVVTED